MKAYTYDTDLFSDLHKDAYGFRPRAHEFWDATPDRKQVIWDNTLEALDQALAEEKRREAHAITRFEEQIAKMIICGANDRETALRWIRDSYDEFDRMYGDGYIEFDHGLPYGYIKLGHADPYLN